MFSSELIRIFSVATLSFLIAFALSPRLIGILLKLRIGKGIRPASETPVFNKLHSKKAGTPTMGGIVIWSTVLILALTPFFVSQLNSLSFLSRSQTWLPLGALVAAAIVGLIDDYWNVRGIGAHGGGIRVRHRLFLYTIIALIGAIWFYFKLDWDVLRIPLFGNYQLGFWYIPVFVFIIVSTSFSVNESDGLDGLAGGLLLSAFATFGAIAFLQEKFDLAALCAVVAGAIVAFLWFNIHPARFFLGDTGAMSLGVTLGIVAMLTNYAMLLPIICFPFVLESVSVIIQISSKKIRKKKVFKCAPLHHHLEAIGWQEPQIVMRFWMIAGVCAVVGLALAIVDINMFI